MVTLQHYFILTNKSFSTTIISVPGKSYNKENIMNRRIMKFAAAAALIFASASHAIIGVGFQWGFDGSLFMENNADQPIKLQNTSIDVGEILKNSLSGDQNIPINQYITALNDAMQAGGFNYDADSLFSLITENQEISVTLPFTVSHSDWNRSLINMGGKVWIDLKRLRIINAIEASFNFGVWEYKTKIKYPSGINPSLNQNDVNEFLNTGDYSNLFTMEEQSIGLSDMGIDYLGAFGVSETPLMKFHLDLTVKKNLVAKPEASKRFKVYLGVGPSLHLSTPVLSPEFVNTVVNEAIEKAGDNVTTGELLSFDVENLKKDLLERLIEEGKNPTFGGHIVLGTSIKVPVLPIAFFGDVKYNLFFGDLDDHVEIKNAGYKRFLVNIGTAINF